MNWFGSKAAATQPSVPPGYRVYAVGDVHGRLDLLEKLLGSIEADMTAVPAREVLLVFLGDLIDRGPDSAGVVERLRTYQPDHGRTVFLLGNHEEVLLRLVAGERGIVDSWLKFGGAECLRSYGIDPASLPVDSERGILKILRDAIPDAHRAFLRSFADTVLIGDYLFVHAGIRPRVEIDRQVQRDLRWIRRDFLDDESDHGVVVVHGHTIADEAQFKANRIGIDTGAYRSGRLTALVLDGTDRRLIDTGNDDHPNRVD